MIYNYNYSKHVFKRTQFRETNDFFQFTDLSSVGDLSFSYIDSFLVNISWSPPFALPGTSVAEYNISVTNNGTTIDFNTSSRYFVLQLSNITDSPCVEINVTVSRYNTVSGIISLPEVTFYLPSGIIQVV